MLQHVDRLRQLKLKGLTLTVEEFEADRRRAEHYVPAMIKLRATCNTEAG